MSSDLENLLIAQGNAIDQLRRSLINFKKLPKAQVTLPKTKGRLTNLEGLWEKVQALHVQLLQTATAEEKKSTHYFKDEEFLAAEDAYLDATDHLHEVIGKLSSDAPSAPYRGNESSYRDAHSGVSLHLPRISLPNFSGAFAEWENFRGVFESLVANSESLTRTQKLHYLKASLSGEAASLINNIQISDANYEAAWLLLTDEYDNRNAIIHAHIHSFADLPKMKNENVTELKKLRDSVSASLAALTNLDRPVDMWDDLLVYIISQKFSPRTRNEWNLKRGNTDAYPTYKEIHDFMTLRIRGLADYPSQSESASNSARGNRARASVNTVSPVKCVRCSGNHGLAKCNKFLSLSVEQRRLAARQHKCCFNCLRTEHFSNNCPSKGRCNQCHQAHHSLLHREGTETGTKSTLSAINSPSSAPSAVSVAAASESPAAPSAFVQNVHATRDFVKQPPHVLLATAYVSLSTIEGRTFKVRALLDQGSTYSFISESLCQTMRTRRHRAALKIHCFGEKFNGVARSQVNLALAPCDKQGPIFPFSGYVYQRITSYTASQQKPAAMWPHLRDLPLADPDPSCNHPIHVLIGADLYGSLLLDGLRQGPVGTPTGQLTIFGWILSGPAGPARPAGESASVLSCVSCEDTNSLIQSFWEDERIPSRTPLTEEDERCEKHFATTHSRDSLGRYIVRLPFKNGPPRVGDTFRKASFLYSNMERRLARKPEIAAQYHDFLREYESMGHMESVRADERPPYPPIYIPHHFVLRESSTTTKLRVVFYASSESTDKTSLNDFLMAGPNLQQDIAAIILRWRLFRYVYMADIAKMFRQILVHRDDADYQRILWRPPDSLLIRLYRLLTVTYGQKPSPFLAQRSLIQLARDEGKDFPDAVNIIEESTYVDDVLFGADDLLSLLEKRKQLVGIMNRGCFPLRKWAANSAELLTDIPEDQRESSDYPINHDDTLKVLGLSWSPRDDSFRFVISPYAVTVHTKRSVLSFIAKLYDPLGWASPIVIAAKMLMQELWLRKIDWDAPIPDDLLHQWINYVSDLPNISKIRIPRWTGMRQDKIDVELHGFADASTRAYAAVVFLRIVHSPSNIQVILLAAKTKVAPLKTVSVPRLELNAVVLLIRLIEWGSKHYVAVFVCLATKAIHLESVEDYSTDGFLAAFQRFVSRRGLPSDMYSDNGTNFVGADRELQRSFRALVNNPSLKEILANDGVRWHFVPPAAPHFGGLWEAGVKSFKHHLRRVTGARTLSRSEFVTLLCKIEACLNSRPISPLSDDPSDYTALTPGHFLIGRPLTSVPEESVLEINANRLSRWQHVQLMLEQIWRSWSSDYLHSLQQRVKWTESHDNPKVDESMSLMDHRCCYPSPDPRLFAYWIMTGIQDGSPLLLPVSGSSHYRIPDEGSCTGWIVAAAELPRILALHRIPDCRWTTMDHRQRTRSSFQLYRPFHNCHKGASQR
ncbi:uncharacterized protein, partial [Temnothorax nylanderi]|uniref:uncharacterized protein n=1 Tax=Temnothorax nylanderi TaxID=102681 RepID=UPI003A89C10B